MRAHIETQYLRQELVWADTHCQLQHSRDIRLFVDDLPRLWVGVPAGKIFLVALWRRDEALAILAHLALGKTVHEALKDGTVLFLDVAIAELFRQYLPAHASSATRGCDRVLLRRSRYLEAGRGLQRALQPGSVNVLYDLRVVLRRVSGGWR